MKNCGVLVVWSWTRSRPNCRSPWKKRCRYLSSLRGAEELRKYATSPVEASAWSTFWETKSNRGSLWLDYQHPFLEEKRPAKTGAACRELYQYGDPHRADPGVHGRVAWCEDLQVGSWSRLCEEGQLMEAAEALDNLVQRGYKVADYDLYYLLKRCIAQKDLVIGSKVHTLAIKSGFQSDTFLANHIICMYASNGRLQEAIHVFTSVAAPDRYMWASIIMAHARYGQPSQAVQLYQQMRQSCVQPDSHIFVATLKACAAARDLVSGKKVHADILSSEVESCIFISTSLVDMYGKCGSFEDARQVFDILPIKNVVTWTAMIAGYAEQGLSEEALSLYANMQQEGMSPANRVTFVCLLQACVSVGALDLGKQLHAQIRDRGLDADVVVGSCLVDMYAKCGCLENARRVFDRLPAKNVVTWTAMITGYAQHGLGHEALSVYTSMQREGISPNVATWNAMIAGCTQHGSAQEALTLFDSMQRDGMIEANCVTFACLLKACASVGALHQAKRLHSQIQKRGLEADAVICSGLVNMYAKCGSLEDAIRVFDNSSARDVVTWNAMINAYGQYNYSMKAMQCFQQMQQHGVGPDDTTFIGLLVACSHEGLVNEGKHYFKQMVEYCGILPNVNHYNCMVDILGRSGLLDEAENMLLTMPLASDVVGWLSLLNACKSHADMDRGRRCFKRVTELEPQNGAAYVLMTNIYVEAGRWEDANRMENLRKSAGACKKSANAYIEVKRKVHTFIVGEERDDIASKLRSVNMVMNGEGGHVPRTELVLKPVSDPEKEEALCGHAEKLALAYGLLNTPEGETLLVTKNLRMCTDCHSGTKVMSRIEKREIIVRDAHRVHHFVNGYCSCGDRH